ncbi:co(2)-response secreted protease, partial [Phtheirospermum japonicum]
NLYCVHGKTSLPRNDHAQLLSELKKRKKADSVVHTYNKSFLGFAARLSDEEANSIAQRPGVVSVFPDRVLQLHTTRSWDFLMSQTPAFIINGSTIPPSVSNWSTGADTIIGIIDTGIWPEHPSFSDKYMGPIPSRWKGKCVPGANSTHPFKCNKKLIGARYYDNPEAPGYIGSARDEQGHGTHVASTAAGIPIWGASYKGLAKGNARGGSPGSRIAMYRVCGADGHCVSSAILKGFDDAIADGVDVLSISLGVNDPSVDNLVTDSVHIGAFHAAEKGVTVVCSAGNGGPSPGTVVNFAPWMLTIAATSIDRDIQAAIVLGGRHKKIKAGGINFSGLQKSAVYHLVDGRSASFNQTDVANASYCIPGSLDGAKVKGKIVVCGYKYPTILSDMIDTLMTQGAVGIIVIDEFYRQLSDDYGTTPFAAVSEADGAQIQSYINSTRNPLATILPTEVVMYYKPAPVVPFFSSRGPIIGIENLLKPDVAAPGVDILAAWPPFNKTSAQTIEPPHFHLLSGTSQACPHVSGLAAMIKSWHPKWSPSAIRSAIMTTAVHKNNLHDPISVAYESNATPYDIGAGEISISGPICPGLVYETKNSDYIRFLCNMGYNASMIKSIASTVPDNFACPSNSSPDLISNMNYPSIAVSGLKVNGRRAVKRTVTNVGDEYSTYIATVEAPPSLQVQVVPNKLLFSKKVKKRSFQVTFKLIKTSNESLFGSFTWSNGKYKVQSPFAISQDKEKR